MRIYTIGHSNHRLDQLASLLNENGIGMLVDVRTAPYSRYSPQYNKETLQIELQNYNIQYVFAGQYLGGRPSDPSLYKYNKQESGDIDYLHQVDYTAVMQREWFTKAVDQLLEMADMEQICLMCSEEDPGDCHRHHLISKYLMDHHPEVEVQHIRGDGTVYGAHTILKSASEEDAKQLGLF